MTEKEKRPTRFGMQDEQGRTLTLAQGPEAWLCLTPGAGACPAVAGEGRAASSASSVLGVPAKVMLLGLGPAAGQDVPLPNAVLAGADIVWLECPAFVANMEAQCPGWRQRIPAQWQALDVPPAASAGMDAARLAVAARLGVAARGCQIWLYSQNMRLFPSFWGPVLGAVQAELLRGGHAVRAQRSVLLPGGAGDLLHQELVQAFGEAGFAVRELPTGRDFSQALHAVLREEQPALCLAVNGRGLDAAGVDAALLQACGVPLALWMVDNPWHILSGWRQGWWRGTHLFVTDHSFVQDLRKAGAGQVWHLPLAAAAHMWKARGQDALKPEAPLTFVGRASFPGRDKFFAAAQVPHDARAQAFQMLQDGGTPHFQWWAERLGTVLWPGHAVRAAGRGAEECSQRRRAQWLEAALPCGLMVYGSPEEWRALLPSAAAEIFHAPVDYYGGLADVYAASSYTLNVTSLLLPAGLTQRHFDVWAAGGFLLSDATQGLEIFPPALVAEMRVDKPCQLAGALHRLENSPSLRRDVAAAWREHIRSQHSYTQRVDAVLQALAL